jgi:hypothetical protein
MPRRCELDGAAAAGCCGDAETTKVAGGAGFFSGAAEGGGRADTATVAGSGPDGVTISSRVPSTFRLLTSPPSPKPLLLLPTTTASPSFFFLALPLPNEKSVTPPMPISSRRFLRLRKMLRLEYPGPMYTGRGVRGDVVARLGEGQTWAIWDGAIDGDRR